MWAMQQCMCQLVVAFQYCQKLVFKPSDIQNPCMDMKRIWRCYWLRIADVHLLKNILHVGRERDQVGSPRSVVDGLASNLH